MITAKEIDGYDGYLINTNGEVSSKRLKNSTLAVRRDGKGYHQVILYKNGASRSFKVHKLVLCAFVGPRGDRTANHKNGNKDDNRLENLEWISNAENIRHSYVTGLRKGLINPKFIPIIREAKENGFSSKSIAEYFGVNPNCINRIVSKTRWSYI